MKPKRKLNVRLLRRIQHHILAEPRRFFMQGMVIKAENQKQWNKRIEFITDVSMEIPPCGTAACIAGWTNILTNHPRAGLKSAARELGISSISRKSLFAAPAASDQVFLVDEWPEPYQSQYENARTPRKRARIAVNRIDYLIRTGK